MQFRTAAGSASLQVVLYFENFNNNPLFILHLL